MPQNELVKNATELLSKSVRQILFDAIIEAIETEKVSDTLLDLNLITQEQSGEILAEGIFQSINKAFDDVFSLPNEGEKESDVEVCRTCGSELEDEDEDEDEETNPVY